MLQNVNNLLEGQDMKRWPFFHFGAGQNWTVRTSANWDLMLALHEDGTHRWVLWREARLYRAPQWQFRFSWNTARKLAELLALEQPKTSWDKSSVFAAPAWTWDLGAAIVDTVMWLVVALVGFILFLAIGNSE